MCVAIPARVLAWDEPGHAVVEIEGIRHRVCVDFVPEVRVGDYVIVHAGFALTIVDPREAEATLALFAELQHIQRAPLGGPESDVHAAVGL